MEAVAIFWGRAVVIFTQGLDQPPKPIECVTTCYLFVISFFRGINLSLEHFQVKNSLIPEKKFIKFSAARTLQLPHGGMEISLKSEFMAQVDFQTCSFCFLICLVIESSTPKNLAHSQKLLGIYFLWAFWHCFDSKVLRFILHPWVGLTDKLKWRNKFAFTLHVSICYLFLLCWLWPYCGYDHIVDVSIMLDMAMMLFVAIIWRWLLWIFNITFCITTFLSTLSP